MKVIDVVAGELRHLTTERSGVEIIRWSSEIGWGREGIASDWSSAAMAFIGVGDSTSRRHCWAVVIAVAVVMLQGIREIWSAVADGCVVEAGSRHYDICPC